MIIQVCYEGCPLGESAVFVIQHSSHHLSANGHNVIEVLLLHVDDVHKESEAHFVCVLEWLTISAGS